MWFFSKKEKQKTDAGSQAPHPPVKVRTMADDLAEKAEKHLPDLPKESRPPESLAESVLQKQSGKASPAPAQAKTIPDTTANQQSVASPQQATSFRAKLSLNKPTAPTSSLSSNQPAPIETSPFLSGASKQEARLDIPQAPPSPAVPSSQPPQNLPLQTNGSTVSSPLPAQSATFQKKEAGTNSPEIVKETVPLQRLEKKQEELRTGNWPIGDEKKPKKSDVNLSDVSDSSDVFSGPKRKSFSADNVIIAEESIGKKTTIALLIVMLLAAAGGGAYYFWQTRVEHVPVAVPSALQDILPQRGEVLVSDTSEVPQYPFSLNESNPFVIDVEMETLSTLQEKLVDNAKKMQTADMRVPVQFTVVDKNNAPIAFFIFASVFNLGLSGDLLNSLGNDFSLYLFLDNGAPRLGLTVSFKDIESARALLKTSEKTLPVSLKNLFLEDVSTGSDVAFQNGIYESVPTRFFNFDTPEPLSIDYAFMRDYLVIGTSKDTLRAIIDEVLKP